MAPNGMAPTYFFYTPEFPENRQQPQQHPGHFIAHPSLALNGMHHGLGMYPMVPTLPSTPVYSRPSSSCSQPPMQHNKAFTSIPQSMTPMASPRPVAHKPAMMLKSESPDLDSYPPSTPPLSISGSASVMSSPGSVDMLQTPLNPMFSGLDGVGSKEPGPPAPPRCPREGRLRELGSNFKSGCPVTIQEQLGRLITSESNTPQTSE